MIHLMETQHSTGKSAYRFPHIRSALSAPRAGEWPSICRFGSSGPISSGHLVMREERRPSARLLLWDFLGAPARVVIPPHIHADIKSHLTQHVSKEPDSLLFTPARGGCHVNDQVFAKDVFKPACKTVGLEHMRVHHCRHFAGTMTARVGNLPETMARLRHSTVKASIGYQSQVSGRDIAVAEALSALRSEMIAAQDDSSQASAPKS